VLPVPPDDEQHVTEVQARADPAASDSPDVNGPDFAESQRSGLVAALSMAQVDAPLRPAPRVETRPVPAPGQRLPAPGEQPHRERRRLWNSGSFVYLELPLLIVILTIQAVLSLRLVWSNTAFRDEAIYLSAGHVEIEHWLHGAAAPPYATYFSGAPVMYPPIAAIADSLGGLAAARILSMIFMLGTTSLLWSTTSRLFDRNAAVCAAALFAVLGPTLQLGAFATFDAMALFLLAASTWCMVASRDRDDSALLLVAGTVLLVLANATAYSTALFDPSVVALAGLSIAARRGVKPAVARGGYVAAGTIGLISALLAIGGPLYLAGVLSATGSRALGGQSARLVLTDSAKWAGLVCVIAVAGVILSALRRRQRPQGVILAVLAVSGLLAPLEQARIHSTTSLSQHVDFGAWFAAAAAGYAMAQLSRIVRWDWLRLTVAGAVALGVALAAGIVGIAQASRIFGEWPNSARMTQSLASLARAHPGNYLAEDENIAAYYLEGAVPWQRWSATSYFTYTPPGARRRLTGLAAYSAAISHHYFSLIILDFKDTAQTDGEIIADMSRAGDYRVIKVVPSATSQYTIWAYEAPQPPGKLRGHR
jgi:hypothetical protein